MKKNQPSVIRDHHHQHHNRHNLRITTIIFITAIFIVVISTVPTVIAMVFIIVIATTIINSLFLSLRWAQYTAAIKRNLHGQIISRRTVFLIPARNAAAASDHGGYGRVEEATKATPPPPLLSPCEKVQLVLLSCETPSGIRFCSN